MREKVDGNYENKVRNFICNEKLKNTLFMDSCQLCNENFIEMEGSFIIIFMHKIVFCWMKINNSVRMYSTVLVYLSLKLMLCHIFHYSFS